MKRQSTYTSKRPFKRQKTSASTSLITKISRTVANKVVRTSGPDRRATKNYDGTVSPSLLSWIDITENVSAETDQRFGSTIQINGVQCQYAFNNNCPCDPAKGVLLRLVLFKLDGNLNPGDKMFQQDDMGSGIDFTVGGPFLQKHEHNLNWQGGVQPLKEVKLYLPPATTGTDSTPFRTGKFFKKLNMKIPNYSNDRQPPHRLILAWYISPTVRDPATEAWVTNDDVYAQVKTNMYYKIDV